MKQTPNTPDLLETLKKKTEALNVPESEVGVLKTNISLIT
jgi:hypothetical protein